MTLTLDAATIAALAQRPAVVAAFPFLKKYAPRPAGCGPCGRAAGPPDWARAAAAIFNLPPARRARFKELTGATRVTRAVVRALRVTTEEF